VDFDHLQLIEDPTSGDLGRFCKNDTPVSEQAW